MRHQVAQHPGQRLRIGPGPAGQLRDGGALALPSSGIRSASRIVAATRIAIGVIRSISGAIARQACAGSLLVIRVPSAPIS